MNNEFEKFWEGLEKDKFLGLGEDKVRNVAARVLSKEYNLTLRSIQETEKKDLLATCSDRLGKDALCLIRVDEETTGIERDDVEDLYSDTAETGAIVAVYIVNSYFSKDARDFASGLSVRLIDRKELTEILYDIEALRVEKAFVSDIDDAWVNKYFKNKLKNKLTNIILKLPDKLEEVDRRYLPMAYFTLKKPIDGEESKRFAYVDLTNGEIYYVDEGQMKKNLALKNLLTLPVDARNMLLELIEQGDLPFEHLGGKNFDILAKKWMVEVYIQKKNEGIIGEISAFISFVVGEIAEPIGIPRSDYRTLKTTEKKLVRNTFKLPPLDQPYDLERYMEVSNVAEGYDADPPKYKPEDIQEILKRVMVGTEVAYNYMIYFPYYQGKYSGPQGVKYEKVYSPKFRGFFPRPGTYNAIYQIIDKFPDLPYLLVAALWMGINAKQPDKIFHVMASSLLFVGIAITVGITLKGIFRTERVTPFYATHDYGIKVFRYGFPSLHSLASAGAVSFTLFVDPGGPILAMVFAPISLFYIASRLRIGAHSRTDVIGGAIIGFVLGIVFGILLLQTHYMPGIAEAGLSLLVALAVMASMAARVKYIK